jgi:hypothetical protein
MWHRGRRGPPSPVNTPPELPNEIPLSARAPSKGSPLSCSQQPRSPDLDHCRDEQPAGNFFEKRVASDRLLLLDPYSRGRFLEKKSEGPVPQMSFCAGNR